MYLWEQIEGDWGLGTEGLVLTRRSAVVYSCRVR